LLLASVEKNKHVFGTFSSGTTHIPKSVHPFSNFNITGEEFEEDSVGFGLVSVVHAQKIVRNGVIIVLRV
jgi:hypothetical protein